MSLNQFPIRIKALGPVAMACALFLTGCSWWSGESAEIERKRGCPQAGILTDARLLTQYREGGGRDITDVAYRWEMLDAAADCSYDDNVMSVTYAFNLAVELGPAARSATTEAPLFIALTKGGQDVINKTVFTQEAEFERGQRAVTYTHQYDDIELDIGEDDGRQYQVVVGFQLTPAQLQENRRRGL